jgi:subfamily B ATP-binding cassette protein MsbA
MVVMLLGQVAMDVLAPWPIKFVFDSVIGNHHLHGWLGHVAYRVAGTDRFALLNLIVAAFIVIAVLDGLFSYTGTLLLSQVGQRFVFDVRRDLFAHVQRLSLRFHGGRRSGDLMARLTGDINNIQDMVVTALSIIFTNTLTIALVIAVMLRLDWRYTLVVLVVVPFMYLAARHYRRAIKQATRQVRRSEGQVSSIVQEVISSIRVVKAFTRETYEQQRFERQSDRSLRAGLQSAKLQAQFAPIIDLLGAFGTVIVLWLGVREVLSGHLTAGELLVFVSYFRAMYSPLRQLAKVSTITARGSASAERVLEILNTEPDLRDLPGARPAPRFRGMITFDHMSFGYDPDRPVLHDISFEVQPGSVTALVGPTGSGKTTTASLIPRFYDPARGAVLIDGMDVRAFTLGSLRAQISLVLQEAVLFQGTIYDNIAYGNPEASADEIRAAAEAANVTEFVDRLPDGFDTVVGERGASLSGGQRQRVAIARALVRNAPILILDEPTVGLDAETGELVLEALQRLMANRTTLVIAHHLASIQHADTIIVLDQGRIAEMGQHEELLTQNGLYAGLCHRQLWSATSRESGCL